MAAALLSGMLNRHGNSRDWSIRSAGTWAEANQPAMALAQLVMAERGLGLEGHRSQPLDRELLQQADVILVMTDSQREAMQIEFPEVANKTYLTSQLIDQSFDIEDPVGGTIDDYRRCARDLENILTAGFDHLVKLTQSSGQTE